MNNLTSITILELIEIESKAFDQITPPSAQPNRSNPPEGGSPCRGILRSFFELFHAKGQNNLEFTWPDCGET